MGKRGREWAVERAKLKAKLEMLGIRTCELRLPGCMVNFGLSFAHAVKRIKLSKDASEGTPQHIGFAALSCAHCHPVIEQLPENRMREIVSEAVANRGDAC